MVFLIEKSRIYHNRNNEHFFFMCLVSLIIVFISPRHLRESFMEWLIWGAAFIIAICLISNDLDKKKRERLMSKYGDSHLVEKLMAKSIWQGQTEGQLIDSIGKPLDIDQKVLKTKVKETWKYDKSGKNRYNLKVVFENGLVVGWDKK